MPSILNKRIAALRKERGLTQTVGEDVPLTLHWRNVLPRVGGQAPRENPQGCRTGTHPLPRSEAYLRYLGPAKRCGHQDRLQYAGTLRCRVHLAHLHPRHPADAGPGGGNHREFHDPDDVSPPQKTIENTGQESQTSCPVLFKPFRTFPRVGQVVGHPA